MGDPTALDLARKRRVIDLTHPLVPDGVPACPGHPKYNAEHTFKLSDGAFANVHTLTIGTHTGTHIDAPYHFYDDACPVDRLDLSLLAAAPAVVVDVRHKAAHEAITWEDLRKYESGIREGAAVLFCTGWASRYGRPDYSDHPYLEVDAAQQLLERGVRVIGADTISPDEWRLDGGDTGMVHRIVLRAGGIIVENLQGLEDVVDSGWENPRVSLLPLSLAGCDGSPIRAVAWER
ncbi:putative cyclase [Rhodofomes roseus]|uniref:Cyclase n=1 Tax=Rhodofomes roseus TaxID=34475 RepID=A0ABQ8K8F1_9APHY|nr:putative cyclase [Rhodofomes roseus]KAH9833521.1 putative cyclase [Rhodofomes roseus]